MSGERPPVPATSFTTCRAPHRSSSPHLLVAPFGRPVQCSVAGGRVPHSHHTGRGGDQPAKQIYQIFSSNSVLPQALTGHLARVWKSPLVAAASQARPSLVRGVTPVWVGGGGGGPLMPARRPSASSGGPWAEVGAPCSPPQHGRPDSLNLCWRGDGVEDKIVSSSSYSFKLLCPNFQISLIVYFRCQTISKGHVNGHVLLLCTSCIWGKVCVQTDRQRLTGVWQNGNCFNHKFK